jgi:hypothetical protein
MEPWTNVVYCKNSICYLKNKKTQKTQEFYYQRDIIFFLEDELYDNKIELEEVVYLTSQVRSFVSLPILPPQDVWDVMNDIKIMRMNLDAFLVRQSLNLLSLKGFDSILHIVSREQPLILLVVAHNDAEALFFRDTYTALKNIRALHKKRSISTQSLNKLCIEIQKCTTVPFLVMETIHTLN